MRTPDDEWLGRLMQAAQVGDGEAYRALLEAITPRVRRAVRRRRGRATAAEVEDLVQDILLSVHKARATYDPSRPFLPWLFAIVHHRVADHRRRALQRTAYEVPMALPAIACSGRAEMSGLPAPFDLHVLRDAVASLPTRQRQAIELVKLREMRLKEAAAALGTTAGALKVAVHRAMAALRCRLLASTRGGR
jgi:RNA polymerase sigma factor (sigma-70 family)